MESLSDEKIKELALDIHRGAVFTDRSLGRVEESTMVFMPLMFIEDTSILEDVGMVYEYLDKAGTMSCNGMPIFMSMRLINRADTTKVWEKYNQIKAAVEAV